MEIITSPINVESLTNMANDFFDGLMVKGVVDTKNKTIALNAELHSDLESLLLENGSMQEFLWGINLYPDAIGSDDFIEFDSLINIRPWQNNRSRNVEDPLIREEIKKIVSKYILK